MIERRDGRVDTYVVPIGGGPWQPGTRVDLAVFQVKGYATGAAADLIRPLVGPDTIVATLQNGLGNEEVLRRAFPANPILVGNCTDSATVVGPGRVRHTGVRATYLGPAEEAWQPAAELAGAAFTGSGFEVHVLSGAAIHRQLWAKFVTNCGSLPTAALSGLPARVISNVEPLMALHGALVRETCAIAAAAGFPLDVEERVATGRELVRTAGGKASMLQDVEAGRKTEIDTINGMAVRYADELGVPAPLNRAMVALVKGREISLGAVEPATNLTDRRHLERAGNPPLVALTSRPVTRFIRRRAVRRGRGGPRPSQGCWPAARPAGCCAWRQRRTLRPVQGRRSSGGPRCERRRACRRRGRAACRRRRPRTTSSAPNSRLSPAVSMPAALTWIGLSTSIPISMRSGMISRTAPQVWKKTFAVERSWIVANRSRSLRLHQSSKHLG